MKYFLMECVLLFLLSATLHSFPQSLEPAVRDQVQAGVAALKAGDLTAAQRHFEAVLKANPRLAEVRANLGLAYYAAHQYQLATARSFLPLSLAAVGRCQEAIPELNREFDGPSNAKLRRITGLSLVKCYMQMDDNSAAAEAAAKLVSSYPDAPDVLYITG